MFLFFTPKNVQFSEKGPEIGFSCLVSKNAKWLRLFHQTVLDENKGTLNLLYFKIFCTNIKVSQFWQKGPEIGLFRPK